MGGAVVATVPGIAIEAAAAALAEELSGGVAEIAKEVPFGAEPVDYLAALERLAEPEEGG